jgi:hypothetical protein
MGFLSLKRFSTQQIDNHMVSRPCFASPSGFLNLLTIYSLLSLTAFFHAVSTLRIHLSEYCSRSHLTKLSLGASLLVVKPPNLNRVFRPKLSGPQLQGIFDNQQQSASSPFQAIPQSSLRFCSLIRFTDNRLAPARIASPYILSLETHPESLPLRFISWILGSLPILSCCALTQLPFLRF